MRLLVALVNRSFVALVAPPLSKYFLLHKIVRLNGGRNDRGGEWDATPKSDESSRDHVQTIGSMSGRIGPSVAELWVLA